VQPPRSPGEKASGSDWIAEFLVVEVSALGVIGVVDLGRTAFSTLKEMTCPKSGVECSVWRMSF
jgi:hypothetical protein